jgi:hypothetical protein
MALIGQLVDNSVAMDIIDAAGQAQNQVIQKISSNGRAKAAE